MDSVRTTISFVLIALVAGASGAHAQQQPPPRTPPRMLHLVAGKEACLTCHAPGANQNIKSTPAGHQFENAMCAMCHRPPETAPRSIPHAVGPQFANCRTCHVASSPMGAPAPPASHESFNVAICQVCHQPAAPPPGR